MRSQFADTFNHDEDAPGYDADVKRESHPIRAGYDAVLNWVIEQAGCGAGDRVLDLGVGTGNLSSRLASCGELDCVDVSHQMMALAREKLSHLPSVEWHQEDILAFVCQAQAPFDAILSTYTIHHLTDDEKKLFFARVAELLAPDGVAAFGDLMFADQAARAAYLRRCRDDPGHEMQQLAEDIEDEFFWDVSLATAQLKACGLAVRTQQFSDLSWGVVARRR